MRLYIVACTVLASVCVACSSSEPSAKASPHAKAASNTASPTSEDVGTPVDGTWRSEKLSEETVVAAAVTVGGASAKQAHAFFSQNIGGGAKRFVVITLRFQDEQFTQWEAADGATPIVGNQETYEVKGDVLELRGSGEEANCVGRFGYKVRGPHLILRFAGTKGNCPPPPHFGAALYSIGPYTRSD
jgi:hypothetical protein